MLRRLPFLMILLILGSITSACAKTGELQTVTPDSRYYAVDPVFREFYNFLGGKEILGEVISPSKGEGITYQYTVAGQLIFDPLAKPIDRFQLGSLGMDFGIPDSSQAEIQVGEPFQALYDRLGGLAFVGKPLTEMAYNKEKNRSEQYFEKLGFYQGPETDGHVRLLPYGAWSCGEECRNLLPDNAAPLAQVPTRPLETPVLPAAVLVSPAPQDNKAQETVTDLPTETPIAQPQPIPAEGHRWIIEAVEDASVIGSNESQVVRIFLQLDGEPLADVSADLFVSLPDGSERVLTFPATGSNGEAALRIEPIQAANGTKIPYQVCVWVDSPDAFCVQNNYTIWTTP